MEFLIHLLSCGNFIDCHIRKLSKPQGNTTMLCRYFIENRVKLPDYCLTKEEELTNVEY
jgi:hypothetical protein